MGNKAINYTQIDNQETHVFEQIDSNYIWTQQGIPATWEDVIAIKFPNNSIMVFDWNGKTFNHYEFEDKIYKIIRRPINQIEGKCMHSNDFIRFELIQCEKYPIILWSGTLSIEIPIYFSFKKTIPNANIPNGLKDWIGVNRLRYTPLRFEAKLYLTFYWDTNKIEDQYDERTYVDYNYTINFKDGNLFIDNDTCLYRVYGHPIIFAISTNFKNWPVCIFSYM